MVSSVNHSTAPLSLLNKMASEKREVLKTLPYSFQVRQAGMEMSFVV